MLKKPKISICVPTYEMHGQGASLLNILLNSVYSQTYKDFEVIISDHSKDNVIENFCKNYGKIIYFKNKEKIGSSSANINNAIKHSTGEYIKPLFQDDFFKTKDALQLMVNKLSESNWVVCGSDQYDQDITKPIRPRSPVINSDINKLALGDNYYSAPSCVLYKKCEATFDDNLIWLMDTWLYRQLHLIFGNPTCLSNILITIKYSDTNVSNTLATTKLKNDEYQYVHKKIYGN